jgi:hypothetical protein
MRFTMSNGAAAVELLIAAGVLVFIAERRGWRPPLWAALSVGLGFRLQALLLTHMSSAYDISNDYRVVARSILHHQDPILHIRPSGWSYLPPYDFVLAGEMEMQRFLHISWLYAGRSFSLVSDLAVIVLVGVIAGTKTGALRRFQYACYPVAIFNSLGRMESTCLALMLGSLALVLHRDPPISGRRALGSGALLGLAVGVNSWPILFLPALWRALPSLHARLRATLGLGAVVGGLFVTMPLTVGTPVRDLPRDAVAMLTYHATAGTWGWSAVVTDLYRLHWYSPASIVMGTVGSLITLAAAAAAVWWWRRAHPLDLASVAPCAVLATTASFGSQYLMWPVATLIALPPKRAWWFHASVNIWSIVLIELPAFPGFIGHPANQVLAVASVLVVAGMVLAMPWERRISLPAANRPATTERTDVPASAPGTPPLAPQPISDSPAIAGEATARRVVSLGARAAGAAGTRAGTGPPSGPPGASPAGTGRGTPAPRG